MPIINGALTDFGLDPLQLEDPKLIFRASSTGLAGMNLLSARKAVETVPASNGYFEVELVSTDEIAPAATHYTVEIRYRETETRMRVSEVLPWNLLVPPAGGALTDLLRVQSNPALVWTGPAAPENTTPGTWWLDPESGDLSEHDGQGWQFKANLKGPAGYSATGSAEDAQALADFVNAQAGPNPFDTALRGKYIAQGQTLLDLRKQPGVIGDGVADDAAAIQAAFDAGASLGVRVYARGTFRIGSTVQLQSAADLTEATFNYTGTAAGPAVRVGKVVGFISRQQIKLPHIINTNKTAVGWGQAGVAGSIGVEVNNLYTAELTVPQVTNFETGLKLNGMANGVSYVNIHLGHLFNNKRNMQITSDATGWANQNTIIGGRMSHNSEEGAVVAGTRHVLMDLTASKANNNNFFGTSLESPNVVEYHLDCAGNDNYFWGCRWENTGAGARVIWRANSIGNLIDNGFGLHTMVETKEANTANSIRTRGTSRIIGYPDTATKAALVLENAFSNSSTALRIMAAGAESSNADKATAWAIDLSAAAIKCKRSTDTQDRLRLDITNGRLYVGAGNAATTRYFGNYGAAMAFDGSDIYFATDNTYDLGAAANRPRYIRAGTAVVTGSGPTANRPAPATAKAGAMFYDTTIAKPIWSDGATWRDAMGTAV